MREREAVEKVRDLMNLWQRSDNDNEAAVAAHKARMLLRELAEIPENEEGRVQAEIVDHTLLPHRGLTMCGYMVTARPPRDRGEPE